MSTLPKRGLRTVLPPLGRKRGPIKHGAYVNTEDALKVRGRRVTQLASRAFAAMPWLRDEHVPLVRQWAELEEIRRALFAGIVRLQTEVLRIDQKDNEVSARRLIHDHRQVVQTQLLVQRELLMTPAARAQVQGGEQPLDLVSMMAAAANAETSEPDHAEANAEGAEPVEAEQAESGGNEPHKT